MSGMHRTPITIAAFTTKTSLVPRPSSAPLRERVWGIVHIWCVPVECMTHALCSIIEDDE